MYCQQGLTSAIPVAEVRESPDIPQAYSIAQAREQEIQLAAPVSPLLILILAEIHLPAASIAISRDNRAVTLKTIVLQRIRNDQNGKKYFFVCVPLRERLVYS